MTAERGVHPRRAGALVVPVLVSGVAAGVLIAEFAVRPPPPVGAAGAATGIAQVVRTNIVNTVQLSGSLSYAGAYTVANQTEGTAYTLLPNAGAVVRRGQGLYEVDGSVVALFYGARPQWRPLWEGVTPGPDVAQLDRNLIALGYGADLSVSDYYTAATAYSVELWQQAAGLPVTGTVPLGQIVFAPGPLRVTSVSPTLGSAPQPGAPVLTATSPAPVVMAQLPVTQEYLVRRGDNVSVTLPDGVTTTPGVVTAVSSVASTGVGGAPDPGASQGPPGGGGAGSDAGQDTVAMTVRLIRPPAGNLDQAPVSVGIVSARARDVYAVPVSALVALAGGGYAVEAVHGGGSHATAAIVPVRIGLFSDTLVQISGPGITAGLRVQVPS